MADNHRVEFGDFALTRLPVGRTEGRLFFVFVRAGRDLLTEADPEDWSWRMKDYVQFAADGGPLTPFETSSAGGDRLMTHLVQFADSGETSVTITYVYGDQVLGEETLELPAR